MNTGGSWDCGSVDAYPFLAFSYLNCQDKGIGVFWLLYAPRY